MINVTLKMIVKVFVKIIPPITSLNIFMNIVKKIINSNQDDKLPICQTCIKNVILMRNYYKDNKKNHLNLQHILKLS